MNTGYTTKREIGIRQHQRHVKRTRSPAQVKRNKSFRHCCNYWQKSVSPSQKELWKIFADKSNTGWTAFLHINLIRVFNDLPPLATPPPEL